MARYRSKVVEIEAQRWFPPTAEEQTERAAGPQDAKHNGVRLCTHPQTPASLRELAKVKKLGPEHFGWISTLEGPHLVDAGDFIVTGLKGEKYPVKPDIFAMKYEEIGE